MRSGTVMCRSRRSSSLSHWLPSPSSMARIAATRYASRYASCRGEDRDSCAAKPFS